MAYSRLSTSTNLRPTTLKRTSFNSFIAVVIIGSLHQQLGVRPMKVCDSVYSTLDSATLDVIANLSHSSTVKIFHKYREEGSLQCKLSLYSHLTSSSHCMWYATQKGTGLSEDIDLLFPYTCKSIWGGRKSPVRDPAKNSCDLLFIIDTYYFHPF